MQHAWGKRVKIFVEQKERNKPLRRRSFPREDNIKISIKEEVWKCVNWIHLVQDRDR
jgi:hypothetical protein